MNPVISLVVGGLGGMLKLIITKHMEFKHQQQMALMEKAGLEFKDKERAATITDKGISFTRRLLAILFALAMVTPVFVTLFNPDATITVPQTILDRSFWDYILPWREGTEVTKYITVKAPILATPIYDICAMIVGFYFGSGGSRAR